MLPFFFQIVEKAKPEMGKMKVLYIPMHYPKVSKIWLVTSN